MPRAVLFYQGVISIKHFKSNQVLITELFELYSSNLYTPISGITHISRSPKQRRVQKVQNNNIQGCT